MITTSTIEYTASGKVFSGVVVAASSPPSAQPGVLVFHGGAGLSEHERERSRMLAELGYVAFVPDLFGEHFVDRAHGMAVIRGLVEQPAIPRERVNAALGCLRAQPNVDVARTAAIGFCFGGLAALELARSRANIRAVVSFHGGLSAAIPARPGDVACRVLVCTGSADPFITREHRTSFEDEMTSANADWQMMIHGGAGHGFTEATSRNLACTYHEGADRSSWRAMRDLFEDAMKARLE